MKKVLLFLIAIGASNLVFGQTTYTGYLVAPNNTGMQTDAWLNLKPQSGANASNNWNISHLDGTSSLFSVYFGATQPYVQIGRDKATNFFVNGNVGIGTTTAAQKLEVAGDIKYSNRSYFGNWTMAATGSWPTNPGLSYTGGDESFGISSSAGQISLQIDGAFRQQETGKVNYFMDKVGVGTMNPDQLLTVKGVVHASEVQIDLNVPGPDYVFENSYKLPKLEEVKHYVDANKHLPEVPSAKEMEKNGIQVGEMNMILLKKVEELTLYIIEQEKRIKKLEGIQDSNIKTQNQVVEKRP